MPPEIAGLHHVTSIAGNPQESIDFYTGVLGLRFVKRTVNFDDPTTYHLYYGDRVGTPGTSLTFFPWPSSPSGEVGPGQVAETTFAVPPGSIDYWADRLPAHGVDATREQRFGDEVLQFWDHDGHPLALVESGNPGTDPWGEGPVPEDRAIRGFHGVTLWSAAPEETAIVLDLFGYESAGVEGDRTRYRAPGDRARVVDLLDRSGSTGRQGVGTVHHVAFRVPDDETQREWQARLREDYRVTDVRDRHYFRSIYFREPGGILFELATEGPGFTADESVESLGSELELPPWLEERRGQLARSLPSLSVPGDGR